MQQQQQHPPTISQNNDIDQRVQCYIRIHNNWMQQAKCAYREISKLLSWPRLDYSSNVENRASFEGKLLHALYYATASKVLAEYYKACLSGANEDNFIRPESPLLPPQMGGRQDFWMIQQPATAPPNLPDTANIGHDAPLAIQHAPQQLQAQMSKHQQIYLTEP